MASRAQQVANILGAKSEKDSTAFLNAMKPVLSNVLATTYTHTQSNTTLAATALSLVLESGKTYMVRGVLFITCNAAGGIKVDLAGGTCSAHAVAGVAKLVSAAAVAAVASTALNTAQGATAAVLEVTINARIRVNVGGTLILQAAQNASSATDSQILAGSFLTAKED